MGGSGSPEPKRPKAPKPQAEAPRRPLQVLHISKRSKEGVSTPQEPIAGKESAKLQPNEIPLKSPIEEPSQGDSLDNKGLEAVTMADLLAPTNRKATQFQEDQFFGEISDKSSGPPSRSLDDFDFDEDAFLAALDENQPIGATGELAKGKVIAIESDGIYVDIGGKAPGFMPKNECGLGVITNLKERFPKGTELEVLVTREQNADGIVTISCRALELRKSWDKVSDMEKEGKALKVKVNGFNRGGVTCDLEGLRGFIPRSQLLNGEKHEEQVGKTISVAFLEVNPDTRKLVLSEKKALIVSRFSELEIGQLITGKVAAIKPYGFFVDLGGVSGLLHHTLITGGSLRSLREVFNVGDEIKAMIIELDPGRGRIGLNTVLLENQPGEIIADKEKVMAEAENRAKKARNALNKEEKSDQ